jgi:hypothetical protein
LIASFAAPLGLVLLGTLPLIAWLHLRRRRAVPVSVPALTPWLALRNALPPSRRQVPRSLLLWLRLAAAACLAFAAAQPMLAGGAAAVSSRVVILDVTDSMGAKGVWSAAVARADALFASTTQDAVLVTLGPRPRVVASAGGAQARQVLAGLRPGGTGADVDTALALAQAVAPAGAELVVVTDGQVPAPGPAAPAARWELVGQGADNVAVVSAEPRSAGGETRLFARVVNFGRSAVRDSVRLSVDGRLQEQRALTLAPGASEDLVWSLPGSAARAEVRLDRPDALPADNVAVVPLAAPARRVQLAGDSPAVVRALTALPDTDVEQVGAATYRTDGSPGASVFVGFVPDELPPGGVVLINPPADDRLGIGADRAPVTVTSLGDAALFDGLDLVGVKLADVPKVALPLWAESLLSVQDRSLVYAGRLGDSDVLVMAFDPDQGELARRLAFPMLMARALDSVATPLPEAVVPAGQPVPAPPGPGWTLIRPDGSREPMVGTTDATGQSGLYHIQSNRPGRSALSFAVISGAAEESNLWAPVLPSDARPTSGASAGRAWWPWLAAIALGLMLAEAGLRAVTAPSPPHRPTR